MSSRLVTDCGNPDRAVLTTGEESRSEGRVRGAEETPLWTTGLSKAARQPGGGRTARSMPAGTQRPNNSIFICHRDERVSRIESGVRA